MFRGGCSGRSRLPPAHRRSLRHLSSNLIAVTLAGSSGLKGFDWLNDTRWEAVLHNVGVVAAAATGFMLANDLLIVVGALVGSSGAILSYIMCRAMNRHFVSVILGGFGTSGGTAATDAEQGEVVPTSVDETAAMLADANEVIIVPGYGMAVAQAQNSVSEITKLLRDKGVLPTVSFTSLQTRAIKTLHLALEYCDRLWIPETKDWRLNERHYGGLTGLDKQQTREKHGDEQVHIWRRSYDIPPPPLEAGSEFDLASEKRTFKSAKWIQPLQKQSKEHR